MNRYQLLIIRASRRIITHRRYLCSTSTVQLANLGSRLNVKTLHDWYSISEDLISTVDTSNELKGRVLAEALMSAHPQHDWQPWRFPTQSKTIWNDPKYTKAFFDYCGSTMGIKSLDAWHEVASLRERLHSFGGRFVLDQVFNGSIHAALSAAYPEHRFAPWKFGNVSSSFWKDRKNLIEFFDISGKILGVSQLEDWYRVSKRDLVRVGGSTVLVNHFGGSLSDALKYVYPDHEWHPWRRGTVPKSFWTKRENILQFLEWLGKQLGIQKLDDWYMITKSQVSTKWPRLKPKSSGVTGSTSPRRFHISLAEMLMQAYPSHSWMPWKFVSGVPMSYWDSIEHQRFFFDWILRDVLKEQQLDAWYKVPYRLVTENGGLGLLANKYGASLPKALRTVYPEHKWLEWKFLSGVSKAFWEERRNQVEYLEWLSEQLGHSSSLKEDWYQATADDFKRYGGAGLLKHHGHKVSSILRYVYPSHKWEDWKFKLQQQV